MPPDMKPLVKAVSVLIGFADLQRTGQLSQDDLAKYEQARELMTMHSGRAVADAFLLWRASGQVTASPSTFRVMGRVTEPRRDSRGRLIPGPAEQREPQGTRDEQISRGVRPATAYAGAE